MATPDSKTADTDEKIFIGKGEQAAWLTLALANRHGLVTGATGTGKTVSLQVLAEGLSDREIGERLHISTETVRTHFVNILGKLHVSSRIQALVFAVRHGAVQIRAD